MQIKYNQEIFRFSLGTHNFENFSKEEIFEHRKNKFLKIGRNDGFMTSTEDLSTLTIKKNNLDQIFKSKKILLAIIGGLILVSSIFLLI